jgi:predicted small secreted protein
MRKALTICVACLTGLARTACNTMQGPGKDIQPVGKKIEEKANK